MCPAVTRNHPPAFRAEPCCASAEITELIHVASLLHDDVIDNADTRRGLRALNTMFGNKVREQGLQQNCARSLLMAMLGQHVGCEVKKKN